jgi:hypothetical protein
LEGKQWTKTAKSPWEKMVRSKGISSNFLNELVENTFECKQHKLVRTNLREKEEEND